MIGAQCLGHRPGLGDAATRPVRRISVGDLRQHADPVSSDQVGKRIQIPERALAVAMHASKRQGEVREQPGPGCALVIGAVTDTPVAGIEPEIARIIR